MITTETWRLARAQPQRRSGWTLASLSLVSLGLYYVHWLFRLHAETPGRVGVDPRGRGAVALPFLVAIVSLVPVIASGVTGDGEVDLTLFSAGMAVNFVAHLLYLRITWLLTGRLAALAEACGLGRATLRHGKRDLAIGVASIAGENIGLKSASLLGLNVPPWIESIDLLLLVVGTVGIWSWSRSCLLVANSFAGSEERTCHALGLED